MVREGLPEEVILGRGLKQLCKDPGGGKSKVLEEGMGWQVHKCYGVAQAEGSETCPSWFDLSSDI